MFIFYTIIITGISASRLKTTETPSYDSCGLFIDSETEYSLRYKLFEKKDNFIEIQIISNGSNLFHGFYDQAEALSPYNKLIWVNKRGLRILKRDYRFKFWSLGALSPSVKTFNLNISVGNLTCFQEKGIVDKYYHIVDACRKSFFVNDNWPVGNDILFMCYRNIDKETCIANKCFAFNRRKILRSDTYCQPFMFNLYPETYVVLMFLLFLISYSPSMVFWLLSEENDPYPGKQSKNKPQEENKDCIPLFVLNDKTQSYYPFISKIGYYIFRHNNIWLTVIRFSLVAFCLHLHLVVLSLANFHFYPEEFLQRKNLTKVLWYSELFLLGIWDTRGTLYLTSIVASIICVVCSTIIFKGYFETCWYHSKTFFHVDLNKLESVTELTNKSPTYKDLRLNILERRFLLSDRKFWRELRQQFFPECLKIHCEFKPKAICLSILYIGLLFPLYILTFIVLLFPLLDIALHIPWNLGESRWNSVYLKFLLSVIILLAGANFSASYISPASGICCLFVSNFIIGAMKNYQIVLPVVVMVTVVISMIIELYIEASEPLAQLQLYIFEECQEMKEKGELILKKISGKYFISKTFFDQCFSLLDSPQVINFQAIAKIFTLLSLATIITICLVTLQDLTLGQVFITVFVTMLPRIFGSIVKPLHNETVQSVLKKEVKNIVINIAENTKL